VTKKEASRLCTTGSASRYTSLFAIHKVIEMSANEVRVIVYNSSHVGGAFANTDGRSRIGEQEGSVCRSSMLGTD
jgi:hypothetical protein